MAKLGDRVLYRVHKLHHTTVQEHVHALVDDKPVPQFETVKVKRDGDGALVEKQVPVMRVTHEGSVHHPHLRAFVGIVGAVRAETTPDHPEGRTVYDVMLLIPNRPTQWVDGVVEGDGDHEIAVREDAEDRAIKVDA